MAGFDLNSIGSLLSGKGVAEIAKRAKVKQSDVAKVLSAGIPALLSGMHDNASDKAGEESLGRALNDHGKDNVENVGAFLKGADLKDGKKILGHVLGGNQKALIEQIAGSSGVTKGKTTTILALAAPLILSLLAQNNNSSGGGILGLLGGLLGLGGSGTQSGAIDMTGGSQSQSSSGGLLGGLLGGGSSSSGLGAGLLGSLLGGNSEPEPEPEQSGGLLSGFLNLFRGK